MSSASTANPAPPWSRSHSNERIARLEFDGPVTVARYENNVGTRHRHSVIVTILRARRHGFRRGGSGRRRSRRRVISLVYTWVEVARRKGTSLGERSSTVSRQTPFLLRNLAARLREVSSATVVGPRRGAGSDVGANISRESARRPGSVL